MAEIIRLWRRSRPAEPFEQLPRLYRIAHRLTGSEADSEHLLHALVAHARPTSEHGPWRWRGTYIFELDDGDGQTVGNDFFSVSPVRNELQLELERHLFGACAVL